MAYSKAMNVTTATCGGGSVTPPTTTGAGIDRKANYTITSTNAGSSSLNTQIALATGVQVSRDCKSVVLTWATLVPAGTYTLTVSSATDQSGNALSLNPSNIPVTVTDSTSPTITSVTRNSTTVLTIVYSEAMKGGGAGVTGSAGNVQHYVVNNSANGYGNAGVCTSGTADITASTDAVTWTITCSAGGLWGSSTGTIQVQDVQDLAGRTIAPNPRTGSF
ncbi:MAG: hypothetical protein FJ034_04805 [Chloroflexi bacterium]|nr:hypothetical protein [Chloroflexota bacterium]